MGGYQLAWFCLSRRLWTSVELKIFPVSYRRRPRQDAPVRRGCQLPSQSVRTVISAHICSKCLTVAAVIFIAGV